MFIFYTLWLRSTLADELPDTISVDSTGEGCGGSEGYHGSSRKRRTLVNAATRLYNRLEEPEGEISQQVTDADVESFDETGMRSEGKTQWLYKSTAMKNRIEAIAMAVRGQSFVPAR